MNRIYFDYAATTPVEPVVVKAMKPYFSERFGNAGSLHSFGQEAIAALDVSREKIAKSIGANFREIIFTGSATEANNLALRGVVKNFCKSQNKKTARIIVSSIEHESILETCRELEKEGVETVYLPVNYEGFVDLKKLEKSLTENTILVSIMYANNEIGTIQNIPAIFEIIKNFRSQKRENNYPLFHTDAVQAFQFLDCNVSKLGVDLMTLSAHKIYGPKGIGCLYIKSFNRQFYSLNPLITGGGQEFGLRSGTENIAAIVGFAKAVELVSGWRGTESKRIKKLSGYFWGKIKKIYPKARLNNFTDKRLPHILNICFVGQSAEELLIKLDLAGIAVSSGSACLARKSEPSYVLKACGLSLNRIKSSLRISFGKYTTKEEIDKAILALSSSLV